MGMVATNLAHAILDAEDPKEFLRRLGANTPKRVKTDISRASRLWPEWDDLDEWIQIAATELEEAESMEFELVTSDTDHFEVRHGNIDFSVYKDEDTARSTALNRVKEDLENEPELFSQDWLQNHIDLDNLRRALHQDARDDDYWEDSFPDHEAKLNELIARDCISDDPRDDTDGEITSEIEDLIDEKWEEMIEDFANERLQDPIKDFLGDIYGAEDAIKQAMDIGGLNVEAAAEDAVNTDGWAHFLASYDGESNALPSGAVYVRQ